MKLLGVRTMVEVCGRVEQNEDNSHKKKKYSWDCPSALLLIMGGEEQDNKLTKKDMNSTSTYRCTKIVGNMEHKRSGCEIIILLTCHQHNQVHMVVIKMLTTFYNNPILLINNDVIAHNNPIVAPRQE